MPYEVEKKYYTLAEISQTLGVPVNQLRIWQKKYSIRGLQKVERGTIRFSAEELERFREIYRLNVVQPVDTEQTTSTNTEQSLHPAMVSLISDSLLEIRNFLVKLRDSS
jgi:DNA-binding transcriptional MerR regulator